MTATRTAAQVYEEFFVPGLFLPCARKLLDAVPARRADRVLDLACGSGVVARQVAALVGAEGRVTGIDLRPGMIGVATSLPPPVGAPIEWREGNALALDAPDASFDTVYCQQGFQFFPDRPKAAREIRRVLASGGRLGVAVWQGFQTNAFMRALTEVETRHLSVVGISYEDIAQPFLFGDREQLHELLEGAGFSEVRVIPASFEARFASPETFVENLEFAYSAVIPEFSEDPAAFAAFIAAVNRDLSEILSAHRQGDEIVFPMHVNLATASA